MNRLKSASGACLVTVVLLAIAAPAFAHGDISSSTPEAGARLKRPPRQVRLVLAEPPAAGSDMAVVDGCGEPVSGEAQRDGATLSASVAGGQPGRWRVRLRSISSVDGHLVTERFSFEVAGKRDCNADTKEPEEEAPDDETSSPPPIADPDEGSAFPLFVPFALGTVLVVGLAFALRRPRDKA